MRCPCQTSTTKDKLSFLFTHELTDKYISNDMMLFFSLSLQSHSMSSNDILLCFCSTRTTPRQNRLDNDNTLRLSFLMTDCATVDVRLISSEAACVREHPVLCLGTSLSASSIHCLSINPKKKTDFSTSA